MRLAAVGLSLVMALSLGCGTDPTADAGPDEGVSAIEAPREALVPAEPPPGLQLQIIEREADAGGWGMLRLYRHEDGDGTLLVAYQHGSDSGPSLRESGSDGDQTWITVQFPGEGQERPQGSVIGRNVPAAVLAEAAENIVHDEDRRDAWLEELPEGFKEEAAAHISLAGLGDPYSEALSGTRLLWRGRAESAIQLIAVRHDPQVAALLRDAIAGEEVTIRGRPGVTGPLPVGARGDLPAAQHWTWTEDDLDVVVSGFGVDRGEVEAFLESLRGTTDADWEDLRRQASQPPPVAEDPNKLSATGSFDGGWWEVTVDRLGGEVLSDMTVIHHADGSFDGGSGGSVDPNRASFSLSGSDQGVLVHGTAPATVHELLAETSSGEQIPLTIARRDDWPVVAAGAWLPRGSEVTALRATTSSGRRVSWEGSMTVEPGSTVGYMALELAP